MLRLDRRLRLRRGLRVLPVTLVLLPVLLDQAQPRDGGLGRPQQRAHGLAVPGGSVAHQRMKLFNSSTPTEMMMMMMVMMSYFMM